MSERGPVVSEQRPDDDVNIESARQEHNNMVCPSSTKGNSCLFGPKRKRERPSKTEQALFPY